MLIERGEQYSARSSSTSASGKISRQMEDVENTNQIRFLRRRYKRSDDGQERMAHRPVGPGGVFTIRWSTAPSLTKEEKKEADPLVWVAPTIGNSGGAGPADGACIPADQASERGGMRLPGQQPGQPVDPSNPQAQQPQTGYVAYGISRVFYNPNQPQQPGAFLCSKAFRRASIAAVSGQPA